MNERSPIEPTVRPPTSTLLAAAVEFAHESYCITDADLDSGPAIVYVNRAFTALTGYEPGEVLGRNPRFLQGPRSDRAVLDELKRCIAMEEEFRGETINYRKDGSAFLMRWYVTPIRDAAGIVTHFLGVQSDATAEREAAAIRDAFSRALAFSPDLVALLDRQGRIEFANPALLAHAGLDDRSIRGRTLRALGLSPSHLRTYRTIIQTLESEGRFSGEFERGAGEARRIYHLDVSRIAGDDPERRYFVTFRDVTQQRRLEAIAEAASFVESVGYLFATLRHELGNPVNSIKTALTVLRQNFAAYSTEKVDDYLSRTLEEVGRVEYLLRSLRSFNAFDRPLPVEVSVRELLSRFESIMAPYCRSQSVLLAVRIESSIETVMADPRAFQQVMVNLVINSVEAMNASGTTGTILVEVKRAPAHVIVRVSDDGPGIPEARRTDVFKPFHTSKRGGTGLGLAIVRKLVTEMHGTVEIAPSEKGASFVLTFDVASTKRPPTSRPPRGSS